MSVRRCKHYPCLNDAIPGRKECYKCKTRLYAERHPLEHTYRKLKYNSRRRGVAFEISLEQWKEFCAKYSYLELRGIEAHSLTVERPNANEGYHIGNMTVLPNADNVRKARLVDDKLKAWPGGERQPGDPF